MTVDTLHVILGDQDVSFDLDFRGRLQKVRSPVSTSLHALFEAVANAFDATSQLGQNGKIIVRILRKLDNSMLFKDESNPAYVLDGYEIEDNGVGFTDENLEHFKKSDTTNKPSGKGVGRLLWLHVFDRAEIDSVYDESGKRWSRSFTFSEKNFGVNNAETAAKAMDKTQSPRTAVRLLSPKKGREKVLTQTPRTLANQLLEHFLPYFTAIRGQALTVVDSATGEHVAVSDVFQEAIGDRHTEEKFSIRSHNFTLHHVFVKPTTNRRNTINLCAVRRVVTTVLVNTWVPEVGKASAVMVDQSLRYHAYLTGNYLDHITNDERMGLKFPPNLESSDDDDDEQYNLLSTLDSGASDEGEVTEKELFNLVANRIRSRLNEHIDGVRRKKEKQLEGYAAKEQPQFRPYVDRAKMHLERLGARPSKRDIEIALYEAKIDGRQDMEQLVKEIIGCSEGHQQVEVLRQQLINQFTREANSASVSALAEYVCTRRAVLSVLNNNLKRLAGDDAKDNSYEEVLHNLFFPRFHTSDDVPCGAITGPDREIAHLWLIDEGLVFHRLLGSDIAPAKLRNFLSTSNERIDIIIFSPAFSATDDLKNLNSVTIIEFKRPGRDDYGPGVAKDPILQVINYAGHIRSGQIEDVDGKKRTVPKETRLYAYVIADVTPSLESILRERGFDRTPDQVGWYWYHPTYNMLIQVIPWDKLVTDAERRNQSFFNKLDLPSS